jgi:hypothetical protein
LSTENVREREFQYVDWVLLFHGEDENGEQRR